jgi:hypothetical protein
MDMLGEEYQIQVLKGRKDKQHLKEKRGRKD